MNLSLALLLLNLVFIAGAQLRPPSLACTSVAAVVSSGRQFESSWGDICYMPDINQYRKYSLKSSKIQNGVWFNCLPQLHYLVVAAFAWMLVEAANMYQLLITVFASSETHFMAKRVVAAWGEYTFCR